MKKIVSPYRTDGTFWSWDVLGLGRLEAWDVLWPGTFWGWDVLELERFGACDVL